MQCHDQTEVKRIEGMLKTQRQANRKKGFTSVSWKMPLDVFEFIKSFSNKSQALWVIVRESLAYKQWKGKKQKYGVVKKSENN